MSVAEDIMDRIVDRLRSIDGAAYSHTLHGRTTAGTYANDLSDADRVIRGLDGPAIPPPYVNVSLNLTPSEDGSTIDKTRWNLAVEVFCVSAVDAYLSDEQRASALALANDVVVAVMADRNAQTAGSLRDLGVEGITPGVQSIYADTEGAQVAGVRVTFDMTYQTTGIGL